MILPYLFSFLLVAFGQNAWIPSLGPVAAVAGFALFWRSVFDLPVRTRFWLSVFWFGSVQGVQLSWMTTTDYMGVLILFVYAGLLFALGIQFGLLTHLIALLKPFSLMHCAAFSGIWVLLEWVRLFLMTGFTWNPVGLSLTTLHLSLQAAALFGIFGLSFWVIFVNLTALRAMMMRTRSAFVLFLVCALLPLGFGGIHRLLTPADDRVLSALLVQNSLLPEERDSFFGKSERMIPPFQQWNRVLGLIANQEKSDLIVLPEGVFPFKAYQTVYPLSDLVEIWQERFGFSSLSAFPSLGKKTSQEVNRRWYVSNLFFVQALANYTGSEVIAGLDETNPLVNAAFHCIPGEGEICRTEKRVLLPIAEYIPFKSFLASFIKNHFGITSSFQAGTDSKIFQGRLPLGVSICYEETFSEITRHLRLKGAELLVTISNDVWFPRSRLAKQHFDHGILRAVENGVPLVRSCNTGVTGAVDCFGRILAVAPENTPTALFVKVPLRKAFTLYSYWGDAAILIISTLFALSLFKKKQRNL